MEENLFVSKTAPSIEFKSFWEAPSNIALVKYWGKISSQIPKNPSLSFTLSKCVTKTEILFKPQKSKTFDFDFYFDGKPMTDFEIKLGTFFKLVSSYIPWINEYKLVIKSQNSFPHSSGIASSASAMAALSLNLMDMERKLFPKMDNSFFYQKASFLARLGSGSAARSIKGPVTIWGKNNAVSFSSDLYAVNFDDELSPIFKTYQNAILIVDKNTKSVTSSQGHNLMNKHPYASNRFIQAKNNLKNLVDIMKSEDLDGFVEIVESEALSLHAMMMTSNPYFILFKPNTLSIIKKIWDLRKNNKIPICFTLDAGANVHLLYPFEFKNIVKNFIEDELKEFCQNGQYILDYVGIGAKKI